MDSGSEGVEEGVSVYGAEDRPLWRLRRHGHHSPRGSRAAELGAAASSLGVCGEWWVPAQRVPASPQPGQGAPSYFQLMDFFLLLCGQVPLLIRVGGMQWPPSLALRNGVLRFSPKALTCFPGHPGPTPPPLLPELPGPLLSGTPATLRVQLGPSVFVTCFPCALFNLSSLR